ncbi:MAG: alpha/beta hydrolase [Ornithinibacter sp.]
MDIPPRDCLERHMRTDVEFVTEDQTTLRGWLYEPEGEGPAPTVVMSHGFSATKEMHLDDFAEVFSAAGLAVLVYDHRNFGASDGVLRGEIDPWQQIRDSRDAITWAAEQPAVDEGRIGVWGSSYSGGHVLVLGAIDRRIRCVVSQAPAISGLANVRRLVRADQFAPLRAGFDADRAGRAAGQPPLTIQVAYENDPSEPAALPTQDTHDYFLTTAAERAPSWRNEVTLRSVEMLTEYEPGAYIANISPTPLMMVVASQDHVTPTDLALSAYSRALEPKSLLLLDAGHFEVYSGPNFERSSAAQRDWFLTHL